QSERTGFARSFTGRLFDLGFASGFVVSRHSLAKLLQAFAFVFARNVEPRIVHRMYGRLDIVLARNERKRKPNALRVAHIVALRWNQQVSVFERTLCPSRAPGNRRIDRLLSFVASGERLAA